MKALVNDSNQIQLGDEIGKTSITYKNIGQEFIITTSDKIELALVDYQKYVKIKMDWIPAGSIFLTTLTTLIAADFNDFIISSDSWKAAFFLLLIGSGSWLIYTSIRAFRYRKSASLSEVIKRIKQQTPSDL